MIIEDTGIIDTKNKTINNSTSLESSKILIMNQVIDHFLPLFKEEIEQKKKMLNKYQIDYKKLKSEVSKNHRKFLNSKEELKRESIIKDIIAESSFLHSRDILYGKNKQIVFDIMNSIKKSDLNSLTSKLKLLRSLTYKNVQKITI